MDNKWGIRKVEVLKKKGRTIIIYGEAGRGKTSLIDTLKGNTLLINLDCGEQVLNGKHIDVFPLITSSHKDYETAIRKFEGFVKWLLEQSELPWKNIVVDNISELQDAYMEALQGSRGVKYPRQLDYRDTGIEMKRHLRDLRNLTYKGTNVIYIAWEDTNKIEDFGGEVQSEKQPMIMGKSCKTVMGLVDFCMALRVDKKGNRYLQLDGDHKYMCKKREEPGQEFPSYIACPKGAKDTLQSFFDMVQKEDYNEQGKEAAA